MYLAISQQQGYQGKGKRERSRKILLQTHSCWKTPMESQTNAWTQLWQQKIGPCLVYLGVRHGRDSTHYVDVYSKTGRTTAL